MSTIVKMKRTIKVPWKDSYMTFDMNPEQTVGDVIALLRQRNDCFKGTNYLQDGSTPISPDTKINELGNDTLQAGGTMRISLEESGRTPKCLTISTHDTPDDILRKIYYRVRAQVMKDERCLERYTPLIYQGVYPGSTLKVRALMCGGEGGVPSVTFNSLANEEILDLTPDGPEWSFVSEGVNFRSRCLNAACPASGQVVYVRKGFGKFNIAKVFATLQCPKCGCRSENSANCGFYHAKYTFTGITQTGETRNPSGRADDERYHTFKEGDNKNWAYLKVNVERL